MGDGEGTRLVEVPGVRRWRNIVSHEGSRLRPIWVCLCCGRMSWSPDRECPRVVKNGANEWVSCERWEREELAKSTKKRDQSGPTVTKATP